MITIERQLGSAHRWEPALKLVLNKVGNDGAEGMRRALDQLCAEETLNQRGQIACAIA